jgi:hypothetical protein
MASSSRGVNSVGYGLVNRIHRAEQVGEVVGAVVIAVDGLPEQRDFAGTRRGELRHLADDVGEPPAPLGAARVRNDAERTAVVAAALYRNEGGRTRLTHRRHVLVVLPVAEGGVAHAAARPGQADQVGQVAVGIGADHEIHPRHPLEQRRPEPLRHAADYSQHVARPLVPLELAHAPDHPLLGVVTHRAGVHQHHVGLRRVVGALVARPAEEPEHELRVGDVHLAAVGLDVDPFHRCKNTPVTAGP